MQLLNQVCFAVAFLGSNTVNLRVDAIPQPLFLDWPQTESHSDKQQKADLDCVVSNMRFLSVGELCNTSFYDDTEKKAVENLVQRVLGARAANRFLELKNIKQGWKFGRGEAVSPAAESNFSALLQRIRFNPSNSRIFLLEDGSLALRWKKSDEIKITVVARASRFDLVEESAESEVEFKSSDLESVIGRLS
jgi:hypothetical protein